MCNPFIFWSRKQVIDTSTGDIITLVRQIIGLINLVKKRRPGGEVEA